MKNVLRNTFFSGCFILANIITAGAQSQQPVGVAKAKNSTGIGESSNDLATEKEFKEVADQKSKEVSKEMDVPKGADIYIENSSRAIVVKTWSQQKVKITTTVYYEGESKFTDDEWIEKSNLSLKILGNSVKIKSGLNSGTYYSISDNSNQITVSGYSINGNAVFNRNGQNISQKNILKKMLTITVPSGSKLDIESKYANVELPDNIGDLNLDISNGNLDAGNLSKLVLRSKYSNINLGDVKSAEVEISNGRFSAKNIDELDIDSKYSTIEMAMAKKIALRSTNDEYELEEAGEVSGRKTYGNLRITKLNNSIDLEGSNSDIKIRNLGASASLVKLNDKYADIRIPLHNTKNFYIDFAGAYSSVYGNFEKTPVAFTTTTDENAKKPTSTTITGSGGQSTAGEINLQGRPSANRSDGQRILVTGKQFPGSMSFYSDNNSPSHFTASSGDGKGLKIDIKCQNCTVDFK